LVAEKYINLVSNVANRDSSSIRENPAQIAPSKLSSPDQRSMLLEKLSAVQLEQQCATGPTHKFLLLMQLFCMKNLNNVPGKQPFSFQVCALQFAMSVDSPEQQEKTVLIKKYSSMTGAYQNL